MGETDEPDEFSERFLMVVCPSCGGPSSRKSHLAQIVHDAGHYEYMDCERCGAVRRWVSQQVTHGKGPSSETVFQSHDASESGGTAINWPSVDVHRFDE